MKHLCKLNIIKTKKIVEKGYTLEVTSWENDGDNYRTLFKTYETQEEALTICNLLKNLLTSCSWEKAGGIANQHELDDRNYTFWAIYNYMKEIPYFQKELLELQRKYYKGAPELIDDEDEITEPRNVDYIDYMISYFRQLVWDLVHGGEFAIRYAESISLTYSPKDIFAQEIFKYDEC